MRENIQAASTDNPPERMGDHNANNRYDMSQISYNHFGDIFNLIPEGIAKVTIKEVRLAWDDYKIISSLFFIIITSNRRKIHNVNYRKENIF